MATNVVMPKMGESIAEGTILRWLKKEGDHIEKDEMIVEISTDKVDTEVPSTVSGTLLKIIAQEKQTVPVGEPIASIATNGEAAPSSNGSAPAPQQAAPSQQVIANGAKRSEAIPQPPAEPQRIASEPSAPRNDS